MALNLKKKIINSVRKYFSRNPKRLTMLLAAALIFPSVAVLAFSYSPMVSIEAEDSTLSGDATIVEDSSASGGESIRFGSSGGD